MIDTPALIIGAGPVGLFQAFQLGLLGIETHLIEALPSPGGQCVALYGDKPIYDIPGVPLTTGQELVAQLLRQIAPFKPSFHLGQLVKQLERGDPGFVLHTDQGEVFRTQALVIAAGVGAFLPRKLALAGLAEFEGRQIHYPNDCNTPPVVSFAGQNMVVLGDDDSALSCALRWAGRIQKQSPDAPARVTLMHRREAFRASEALVTAFKSAQKDGLLHFLAGQITGFAANEDAPETRLTHLQVLDSAAQTVEIAVDHVLPCLGLAPQLGPVAHWGLDMVRKQLGVNPESCSTNQAGIYAVGDINTYPGKKKLILCGFHEATLAAYAIDAQLHPNEAQHLQYTTTSPTLHRRLGVLD